MYKSNNGLFDLLLAHYSQKPDGTRILIGCERGKALTFKNVFVPQDELNALREEKLPAYDYKHLVLDIQRILVDNFYGQISILWLNGEPVQVYKSEVKKL